MTGRWLRWVGWGIIVSGVVGVLGVVLQFMERIGGGAEWLLIALLSLALGPMLLSARTFQSIVLTPSSLRVGRETLAVSELRRPLLEERDLPSKPVDLLRNKIPITGSLEVDGRTVRLVNTGWSKAWGAGDLQPLIGVHDADGQLLIIAVRCVGVLTKALDSLLVASESPTQT